MTQIEKPSKHDVDHAPRMGDRPDDSTSDRALGEIQAMNKVCLLRLRIPLIELSFSPSSGCHLVEI